MVTMRLSLGVVAVHHMSVERGLGANKLGAAAIWQRTRQLTTRMYKQQQTECGNALSKIQQKSRYQLGLHFPATYLARLCSDRSRKVEDSK